AAAVKRQSFSARRRREREIQLMIGFSAMFPSVSSGITRPAWCSGPRTAE
ncbi:unnamed protein product, partial [Tilletia caries]